MAMLYVDLVPFPSPSFFSGDGDETAVRMNIRRDDPRGVPALCFFLFLFLSSSFVLYRDAGGCEAQWASSSAPVPLFPSPFFLLSCSRTADGRGCTSEGQRPPKSVLLSFFFPCFESEVYYQRQVRTRDLKLIGARRYCAVPPFFSLKGLIGGHRPVGGKGRVCRDLSNFTFPLLLFCGSAIRDSSATVAVATSLLMQDAEAGGALAGLYSFSLFSLPRHAQDRFAHRLRHQRRSVCCVSAFLSFLFVTNPGAAAQFLKARVLRRRSLPFSFLLWSGPVSARGPPIGLEAPRHLLTPFFFRKARKNSTRLTVRFVRSPPFFLFPRAIRDDSARRRGYSPSFFFFFIEPYVDEHHGGELQKQARRRPGSACLFPLLFSFFLVKVGGRHRRFKSPIGKRGPRDSVDGGT